MWNWIKTRWTSQQGEETAVQHGHISQRRPELRAFVREQERQELFDGLWNKLRENRLDSVVSAASQLLDSTAPQEALEAHKIMGQVSINRHRYQEAVTHFRYVVSLQPSADSWFNLATAAVPAGELELGEEAFEQALEISVEQGNSAYPSVPFMRLYFCCALIEQNAIESAFHQVNILRSNYEKVRNTDQIFLQQRGLPSLQHTMKVAENLFKRARNHFDYETWLAEFSGQLDPAGQQLLEHMRVTLKSGV